MSMVRRLAISLGLIAVGILAATPAPMARADEPGTSESEPLAMPHSVLRRLTGVEYSNSLHDIFGVRFSFTDELPPDGQAGGFDNNGDALSLTPVLLETYLKLARKVGNLSIGGDQSLPLRRASCRRAAGSTLS